MFSSFISYLKEKIEIKLAIKSALAAILSLYLCVELDRLVPRPEIFISGLWCVVASIVVLQPYVGGTYKAVINRFLGVAIGSFIGALFAYFLGGGFFILGLAILITISICSLLNLKEGYRIAGLSVAVTIIPWVMHPDVSPWSFAFFRFMDTCLGILVAVIISHTVWPSQAGLKVRLNIAHILDLLQQFSQTMFILTEDSKDKKNKIEQELSTDISRLLIQTRLIIDDSQLERITSTFPLTVSIEIITLLEVIFKDIDAIREVYNKELESILDEELRHEVEQAINRMNMAFKHLSSRIVEWQNQPKMENLNQINAKLTEQQNRFRDTKTTRKYSFEFVERYFVFFYSLKAILQKQNQLNTLLDLIQTETDSVS